MLLEALRDIPGTIQIVAGQHFHENDQERADYWLRTGFARAPGGPNSRGWVDGLKWDGAYVAILASGQSLTIEQCDAVHKWRDADRAQRKCIAINTTFRRALWGDVLYACDGPWWNGRDKLDGPTYGEEAKAKFAGELWTQDAPTAGELGINLIRSERAKGLSRRPGIINQGDNGGHQAIGLAYQSGASRVYLLGYDMRGGHWHGKHPGTLERVSRFDVFVKSLATLAGDIKPTDGFEVINCTPKSALTVFPVKPWEEVFA